MNFKSTAFSVISVTLAFAATAPAAAQDNAPAGPPQGPPEDTVFDDTWVTVGAGIGLGPSYTGSDDYQAIPVPLVRGKIGPVRINPRPAGLALDFLPKSRDGVNFELGPTFRFRNDRAVDVKDDVVARAAELDSAIEIGAAGGVNFSGVLSQYDTISVSLDARWDVAGAHDGMVVQPGVTYLTPLSRGTAVIFGVSAEFVDDDFADYYYSVTPAQSAATGLPQFQAEGGLNSLGTNLLVAVDLDGDIANGGFGVFGIGGYSRLMGDGADTPYTSIRGSADQFFGGVGVAYTF